MTWTALPPVPLRSAEDSIFESLDTYAFRLADSLGVGFESFSLAVGCPRLGSNNWVGPDGNAAEIVRRLKLLTGCPDLARGTFVVAGGSIATIGTFGLR